MAESVEQTSVVHEATRKPGMCPLNPVSLRLDAVCGLLQQALCSDPTCSYRKMLHLGRWEGFPMSSCLA